MRHNKAINHLGRKSGHRKAMLANMASSLIQHKRITTTLAKAKALKMYMEPLITKSKETRPIPAESYSATPRTRKRSRIVRHHRPEDLGSSGRIPRVLHSGFRKVTQADMALVEFVDFNEAALKPLQEGREESNSPQPCQGGPPAKEEAPEAQETKAEEE